ncbi:type II toxin-antitoxin system MqsA family antitoxin (plasmid) [Aquincola tertiaricarbonis]|uniref:Type II toxin-antitoxin system MqsA family antitoxin n=1 Tax=Aquincola tertiaricarbonis TaxID=391953 RepID=A0ABY4SFA2_AQUTE|nr:type II toxin-antitoxin system MqsA family antitoxin [Aquincola tertiaricarbonis]URI11992.1 type II toxin-antitoxin system MqsA family antitoxin [Aquincola tertiaricarbonis]
MICPECGAAELVHDTRDMPVEHNGQTTTIPAVSGDYCPACGEAVLDREQGDRVGELVGAFVRQVDGPAKRYTKRYKLEDLEVFDGAYHLQDEEQIQIYLEEMAKENHAELWAKALDDVARARERWNLPVPGDEPARQP